MDFSELRELFQAQGACAAGGVTRERLYPLLGVRSRKDCEALCPGWKTVLCATWSYLAPEPETLPVPHLCRYARGKDYHAVIREALAPICAALAGEGAFARPTADVSPLPEVLAAEMAGIGRRGKHGLLLVPGYGSWIFLGTILTDAAPDLPVQTAPDLCTGCGACLKACPTGVLAGEDRAGVGAQCLSWITQKPGALTPEEEALILKSGCFWGCDRCQEVCPVNRAAAVTHVPGFRDDLLYTLDRADLEGLSRKMLTARMPDRAFTWKGPAVLRRNLSLFLNSNV